MLMLTIDKGGITMKRYSIYFLVLNVIFLSVFFSSCDTAMTAIENQTNGFLRNVHFVTVADIEFSADGDVNIFDERLNGMPYQYKKEQIEDMKYRYTLDSCYRIPSKVLGILTSNMNCEFVYSEDIAEFKAGEALFHDGEIISKELTDYDSLLLIVDNNTYERINNNYGLVSIRINDEVYKFAIIFEDDVNGIDLIDVNNVPEQEIKPVFYAYNGILTDDYSGSIAVEVVSTSLNGRPVNF